LPLLKFQPSYIYIFEYLRDGQDRPLLYLTQVVCQAISACFGSVAADSAAATYVLRIVDCEWPQWRIDLVVTL